MSSLDPNASADAALMGGAKADAAFGVPQPYPVAGLRYMPGSGPGSAPSPDPTLLRMRANVAGMQAALRPAAPPRELEVGYDQASDTIYANGQQISGSNLSQIAAADQQGLFSKQGEIPQGLARVPVSQIRQWVTKQAENRGAWDAAKEVGKQALAGVADIGSMASKDLAMYSPKGSWGEQVGAAGATAIDKAMERYQPDVYKRGEVSSALVQGARSLAPSGVGMGVGALGLAGGPVGTAAAGTAIAGFYGGAQAWDTYQKALAAGKTPEEAKSIAMQTGAIEGLGETVGDIVGGKILASGGKWIGGKFFRGGADAMVAGKTWARPTLGDIAGNAAVQAGTEYGQGYGEAAVERAANISNEDPHEQGMAGFKAGLGLSALLAPFGLGAGYMQHRQRVQDNAVLADKTAPSAARFDAAARQTAVISELKGPDAAEAFYKTFLKEMADAQTDMLQATGIKPSDVLLALEDQRQKMLQLGYDPKLNAIPMGYAQPEQPVMPMGYNSETTPITGAGQQWQGMGVQPSGPVGVVGTQTPSGPAEPASVGQLGQQWQSLPQSQPALDVTPQTLDEQRLAAQVSEGQQLTDQARADALAEQRIAAVKGTVEPLSSSGVSPTAVASPVAPAAAQAAPEPFNRAAHEKMGRTELALKAQGMGIQVKGKMRKAAIIDAIEAKMTGKTAEAAPTQATKPATAENVSEELDAILSDEKAASAGLGMTSQILQSATRTAPGSKPRGKISIAKEALAGVVRSLFSLPRKDGSLPTPVIYKPGTATMDQPKTVANASRMNAMRDAAVAVMNAYEAYVTRAGNITPTDSKVSERPGTRAKQASTQSAEMRTLAQQLKNAVDNLVAVSGSAANVNALVAAFKTRTQEGINQQGNQKRTPSVAQAKHWESSDTRLSRAWKMYNDGFLDDTENLVQVSTGDKRNSWEQDKRGGAEAPLKEAADTGVKRNVGPKTKAEKGIMGVLAYLQSHGNTPFERMLASAVGRALRKTDKMPKVVFDVNPGEHAAYNPADDTIHLRETSSAEEALHEALHAALQWVVYTQPNNPAVQQLRQALKDLMAYDRSKLTSENAKNAYDIIAGLVKKGGQGNLNAAMLELVSYGNTMPDFAAALRTIPSTQDQQFKSLATKLFDMLARLVQKFLGVSNTVANDVLQATMKLLEDSTMSSRAEAFGEASKGQELNAAAGQTLYAAVSSSTQPQNAVQPGLPPNRSYAKTGKTLWDKISTEFIFKALGWEKVPDKMLKASGAAADAIKEASPTLTRWIGYVNANFGVPIPLREALLEYKTDRHIGAQMTDLLANYIESKSASEVLALVDYLDGNKNALAAHPNMKEVADMVARHRAEYIAEIRDQKTREFYENLKFSESMVFAKGTEGLASRALGARKLNELLRHTSETVNVSSVHTPYDAQGNPVLDGNYVRTISTSGPDAGRFAGFRHVDLIQKNGVPAGEAIEANGLQWRYDKKVGRTDVRMSAVRSARYAIEKEGKANEVANALRNTMSILAANYASNRLTDALANEGAAQGVVFDNLQELEKHLGKKVSSDSILPLSASIAKSSKVQGWFRSKHQWVRIPNGPTYGALAGKLVNGSVWASIEDMTDRRPIHNIDAVHGAMRIFKKAKTIYNPGTHLGNVGTNFTLAMMHDIPMTTVGTATRLLFQYSVNPDKMSREDRALVHQFMNSGAMLGDYSSIEVKKALYDAMKGAVEQNEPEGISAKIAGWLHVEAAKKKAIAEWAKFEGHHPGAAGVLKKATPAALDRKVTELYAAEDNAFRFAAFLSNLSEQATGLGGPQNLSEKEYRAAGTFARDAFLDYDIDSKAVKILRATALPFISWTYAIMPVLGRIALHKPWKLANVMLGYYLIEQAMAAAAGDDDEELRKRGPEYIRQRLFGVGPYTHIRIPFMGDDQNPVYFKLGAYIPLGNVADPMPNGFMGVKNWPQQVSPNGPFIAAILGAVGGIDPYTGKPLSQPTASDWEAFLDRSALLGKQVTPPWAPAMASVSGIVRGAPEKGYTGADTFAGLKAARDIGGLKLYQYNVAESTAQQQRAAGAIKSEFQKEIAKLRRTEMRYEEPDWEGFNKRRDELLARRDERIKEAKGEE